MSELEFWKDLGNIFDAVLNYQKKNVEFNNRFINPWIRLGNIFDTQSCLKCKGWELCRSPRLLS